MAEGLWRRAPWLGGLAALLLALAVSPAGAQDRRQDGPQEKLLKIERELEGTGVRSIPHNFGNGRYGTRAGVVFGTASKTFVTFEDERFLNADNANAVDSYWLADTRIGLTGEKFEFLVYINNLLDDDTIQTGGTGPAGGREWRLMTTNDDENSPMFVNESNGINRIRRKNTRK